MCMGHSLSCAFIYLNYFVIPNIILPIQLGNEVLCVTGYLTAKQVAGQWDITDRQVQILCKSSRINGAERIGGIWLIPENAVKPTRYKAKNKPFPKKKEDAV